nr:hypothetical protein [Tanacetum cinerariifolium]
GIFKSRHSGEYIELMSSEYGDMTFTVDLPVDCVALNEAIRLKIWSSDQANTLTRYVNEVVAELADKYPFTLPPSLRELEGTTHIFQFLFDTMATSKRPDFILDKVFKRPVLTLPPPSPIQAPEPYVAPEGHHTSPEPEAAFTTHQDLE